MSARILFIKKAYIEDEAVRASVHDDMSAAAVTLTKIFPETKIDTCAITEEGEWLMHGKSREPFVIFAGYDHVFVFIHSGDKIFDRAEGQVKAYAQNSFFVYRLTDILFHHAERLHALVKTNVQSKRVKFPHQKHVSMKEYNDSFTSVEDIVRKHVRDLFLPIHIIDTEYSTHPKRVSLKKDLAYNATEFAEHLHELRHHADSLTFREHIDAHTVYVVSVPHFRNKRIYTTIPLVGKDVNGIWMWDVARLTSGELEEVMHVAEQVSGLVFSKQLVVYALSVHPKRGVFIQSTSPLFSYLIHQPDFFFAAAEESGISPLELCMLLKESA
jgi:hypothetical protein